METTHIPSAHLKPLQAAGGWQGGGGTPRTPFSVCGGSSGLWQTWSTFPISRPEPHLSLLNGNTTKHPLRLNSCPCSVWRQTPPLTTLSPMSGAVDYMKFLKALEKVWIVGFEAPSALKSSHLQKCRSRGEKTSPPGPFWTVFMLTNTLTTKTGALWLKVSDKG